MSRLNTYKFRKPRISNSSDKQADTSTEDFVSDIEDKNSTRTPTPKTKRKKGDVQRTNYDSPSRDSNYNSDSSVISVGSSPRTPVPEKRKTSHTKLPVDKAVKKNDSKDGGSSSMICKILIGLLTLIPIIAGYAVYNHLMQENIQNIVNIPLSQSFQLFRDNIKTVKQKFLSQKILSWKTILASVKHVLDDPEPEYPATLLFVIPKGKDISLTGSCLAYQVVEAINRVYNSSTAKVIDIKTALNHKSDAEDKYELDHKLREVLDSSDHSQAVVVDHFEELPPKAVLLFHGYCDSDNAPYKQAIIILILHTDISPDVLSVNNNYQKYIDDHLTDLWQSGLDEDKIPPLIARVANNKVVVTEENMEIIQSSCPWLRL